MSKNRLITAAAGSGKTTYLVKEAVGIKNEKVLITTYTRANEAAIREKIVDETNGYHPPNITVQTWFSFLLQHGVRPYQSSLSNELDGKRVGFYLSERKSGRRYENKLNRPVYWGEDNFLKYYFTRDLRIYSDKISKFIYQCNNKTQGELISRLSRIYPHIFIDEVQDLAGWDLEIIKLLFETTSYVLLVGDPRQVTYLTHHPTKHVGYKNGKLEGYIKDKCKRRSCEIDKVTLSKSHRNNAEICAFSSNLFPEFGASEPCSCERCRNNSETDEGVFLVKEEDVEEYCEIYSPTILKYKNAVYPELNYGKSKGLSFDRVLIFPTKKIKDFLKNGDISGIETIKAKFYVALTRARYSAAIVVDYDDSDYLKGLRKYKASK